MRRLVEDDDLREELIRHGRGAVAGEFDVKRSAGQLRDLFVKSSPC
jgi:hypothetical protein